MNKCEYCGYPISDRFPERSMHKLCKKIKSLQPPGRKRLDTVHPDKYWMIFLNPKIKYSGNAKKNSRGYYYEHEIIWEVATGNKIPEGFIIDHLRGNTAKQDNRPCNLRLVKLESHVRSHKKSHGKFREYKDKKTT